MFDDIDYVTAGGVRVARRTIDLPFAGALDGVAERLDTRRGALLSSSYEFPGRYKRWSMAFYDPPLELATRGDGFTLAALNQRGRVLLPGLARALDGHPHLTELAVAPAALTGRVRAAEPGFAEAERSRQPSTFSIVRAVIAHFASAEDGHLGLYGAFGYDLVYQFEPMALAKARPAGQRDLVAFLPDALILVDNQRQQAVRLDYEFTAEAGGTTDLPRDGAHFDLPRTPGAPARRSDYPPGGYADLVRHALPYFARGDLFEVVPGQSFYEPCNAPPSVLFETLRRINPSPYGFLLNLGGEHLIGASPEMFVRVEGRRVETCPISGTIARGRDALEDAERILTLLSSRKDEAELTMCTDVDRNDKSRVCKPGSVRVIGRRQIELYSHLIHTVDHVEGELRDGADGLDAFLSHAWAVTVTGAPKRAALAFIETLETTPRGWYGGAIGCLGFNGDINTGLTLRMIHLKDAVAEIRVGATLLADSVPEDEERETHVKAAASLKTIALARAAAGGADAGTSERAAPTRAGDGKRVLLVDCEDSFVHTLASYVEATGAAVTVLRHRFAPAHLDDGWDLVVLSPGPGRPEEFGVPALVRAASARGLPVFGVCLGLQGIVEAFGGALAQMPEPRHGKPGTVTVRDAGSRLFHGLPTEFAVGRYHSLHAPIATLPSVLRATAVAEDGVVMAIEHTSLPIAAVQFHPESIMTLTGSVGPRIIANVMTAFASSRGAARRADPERRTG
ncbi:MAG TPA: anthranilate synthase component I [Candidatus Sulfotelmatobacter sp.]|nr:anthranilate synthase component I [Candidatus Sulfotelmatobacter sp.]